MIRVAPARCNARAPELDSVTKDAAGKDNLAATNAEKVKALAKRLDAWWKPE